MGPSSWANFDFSGMTPLNLNTLVKQNGELWNDRGGTQAASEQTLKGRGILEIHVEGLTELTAPKFLQQPRFPHLPSALKQQWLPRRLLLPLAELFKYHPFHDAINAYIGLLCKMKRTLLSFMYKLLLSS